MATPTIEVRGMKELLSRMAAFPGRLRAGLGRAMEASLNVLWENVPAYPPPPEGSTYRRTGTLGRSIGSSASGGKSGSQPSIFETRAIGSGMEGRFGTNLSYAEYVIGDGTQAKAHRGRWWVITDIAKKAKDKINQVWRELAQSMANFLDGKGQG